MRRLLLLGIMLLWTGSAAAAERYVLIVSGASGGEKYSILQEQWRQDLAAALQMSYAVPSANIVTLDEDSEGSSRATADNVRRMLGELRQRITRDDTLLLVMFGHGTIDGTDAKFNLVGPDLTASDWRMLLEPLSGHLVVVNTTESSFPFIEQLSRKGRVVITATDSTAQRFATMFPEYFVKAFVDPSADIDKDRRISIWEAFASASSAVKKYYEQRGQLTTERPLLDDDGDGVGRESEAPGGDGMTARTVFLDAPRRMAPGDAELAALESERSRLQRSLDELRERRPLISEEQYRMELEDLLVRLARVSAEIRRRS
jgi:hypothetical protein